jgi:TRAP-type C4-dicarboxylate transport system permease small subunit
LLSEREHIIFDVIYAWFRPGIRRWIAIFNTLSLGIVFLVAVPAVFDYIHFSARRSTMLLHLRFDLVYSCFAIFILAVVVGAAIRLRGLAGSKWREAL